MYMFVCMFMYAFTCTYLYLLSLEPKCAVTMLCSVNQSMCARAPGVGVSSLGHDPSYPSWSGPWFCSHATGSLRHGSGVDGQLCLCNRVGQTQGSMLLTAISTLKPIMLCTHKTIVISLQVKNKPRDEVYLNVPLFWGCWHRCTCTCTCTRICMFMIMFLVILMLLIFMSMSMSISMSISKFMSMSVSKK